MTVSLASSRLSAKTGTAIVPVVEPAAMVTEPLTAV